MAPKLPVLLEAFPVPPSFVPPSPNGPLSGPPVGPLPPVPGPSKIRDSDTMLFLSASRRSSKYSIASSKRPDSIASNGSSGLPYSRDSISSSLSSHSHSLSLNHQCPPNVSSSPPHSSPTPEPDDMDPMSSADMSISSISMNDLPASDDLDDIQPTISPIHFPRADPSTVAPSAMRSFPALAPYSPRSTSPDLSTLLSQTPRPRRQSKPTSSRASSATRSSGSRHSRGTHRSLRLSASHTDEQYVEEYGITPSGQYRKLSSGFGLDDDVDLAGEDEISKLQRQLEGEGSDSDSGIDLHTPLSHMMLRQGVLSPNSKLLTSHTISHPPTPAADGRSPSRFSVASHADSIMTKSGILKDARDTPSRRVRHRDGKLLKGGIGLTTGLGWSDSEDEDAPSALTRSLNRKVSDMNLSRRSVSSLRSSSYSSMRTSSHLSHSFSQSALDEYSDDDDYAVNTFHGRGSGEKISLRLRNQPSLPPTAWARKGVSRASIASSNSTGSLSVTIPRRQSSGDGHSISTRTPKAPPDDTVPTSATSSSISIPLPVTPLDEQGNSAYDREKMLPSLPNPRTGSIKRYASNTNVGGVSRLPSSTSTSSVTMSPLSRQRAQTLSTSSSEGPTQKSAPPMPTSYGAPRTLRLPTRSISSDRLSTLPTSIKTPQQRTLRTPSAPPTPSGVSHAFPPSTPHRPRLSEPLHNSVSPAPAGVPVLRRARVGAGMVYRTSSAGSNLQGSRSTVGLAL